MTLCGETDAFDETYRSKLGVSFEWKIPDIRTMPVYRSDHYTSHTLEFSDSLFYFCIYPKGKHPWPSRWIALVLMRFDAGIPVRVSIGIKKDDGFEEEITSRQVFPGHEESLVITKFLHWSDLLNRRSQLAPSYALTVTCTLYREVPVSTLVERICPPENRREFDVYDRDRERNIIDKKSISALRKQFKDLLSSSDDHDVTIKVRDREFSAHKCILRARCPVFEAMFKHKIRKSADNSITIKDCDPDTFGEFLNYIYAGQVEDMSATNAVQLYNTADKYEVSSLKETCVHMLKESLSVSGICDVITLATKHGEYELLKHAIHFFASNMKEIIATPEWRCFFKRNPDEAYELFIKSCEWNDLLESSLL